CFPRFANSRLRTETLVPVGGLRDEETRRKRRKSGDSANERTSRTNRRPKPAGAIPPIRARRAAAPLHSPNPSRNAVVPPPPSSLGPALRVAARSARTGRVRLPTGARPGRMRGGRFELRPVRSRNPDRREQGKEAAEEAEERKERTRSRSLGSARKRRDQE